MISTGNAKYSARIGAGSAGGSPVADVPEAA
jgi:hypothetical protein